MKLAPGALAARLATGALHGHEATAEEGLTVKDLGEAGTSPSLCIGQMASRAHRGSPPFGQSFLIYINISDTLELSSHFSNANLLKAGRAASNHGIHRQAVKGKNLFTEFLACTQRHFVRQ